MKELQREIKSFCLPRLILTIGFLSIGILSCTNDTFDHSVNGSWTVFSFENLTAGTTEFKTQENSWNKDIKIHFDDTRHPNIISGTNTTNQISGEFKYVGKNRLTVSNLGTTEVNQPRWADEFVIAVLDHNLTYKITDDKLVIYYDNKSKRLTLKRD